MFSRTVFKSFFNANVNNYNLSFFSANQNQNNKNNNVFLFGNRNTNYQMTNVDSIGNYQRNNAFKLDLNELFNSYNNSMYNYTNSFINYSSDSSTSGTSGSTLRISSDSSTSSSSSSSSGVSSAQAEAEAERKKHEEERARAAQEATSTSNEELNRITKKYIEKLNNYAMEVILDGTINGNYQTYGEILDYVALTKHQDVLGKCRVVLQDGRVAVPSSKDIPQNTEGEQYVVMPELSDWQYFQNALIEGTLSIQRKESNRWKQISFEDLYIRDRLYTEDDMAAEAEYDDAYARLNL